MSGSYKTKWAPTVKTTTVSLLLLGLILLKVSTIGGRLSRSPVLCNGCPCALYFMLKLFCSSFAIRGIDQHIEGPNVWWRIFRKDASSTCNCLTVESPIKWMIFLRRHVLPCSSVLMLLLQTVECQRPFSKYPLTLFVSTFVRLSRWEFQCHT